jgi:hypothetical protein
MIDTSIGKFSKEDFVQKANEGILPENLIIKENLTLNECTSLRSLPKGLQVEGSLQLYGCNSLTTLPKGLQVLGWLFLTESFSLTALPSDMKVGGMIYVDDSFIQNYPFKDLPKILHLPFVERQKNVLLERLK